MTTCELGFRLDDLPALSRTAVDRDDPLRDDPARLARLWPTGRLLLLDSRGRAPMVRGDGGVPRLDYRSTELAGPEPAEGAVLLGAQDGQSYWAVRAEADGPVQEGMGWDATVPDTEGPVWQDLRLTGGVLSDTDAGLLTAAVAVLSWHDYAGFCAKCGSGDGTETGWVGKALYRVRPRGVPQE